jgi:hypothetical protein
MRPVAVDLLRPHPLGRWILPLGFLGLGAIVAVMMALPKDAGATFFWAARLVFVIAYRILMAVGMSRTRRAAQVTVDAGGLREGGTVLATRDAIERVLSLRVKGVSTIELRGKVSLWLELASAEDAELLLAELDPGRDAATVAFLATTTPLYLSILAWMGVPALMSIPAQLLMTRHVEMATVIALVTPCVLIWLFATWWFMRRRKITISTTELGWPRLFSNGVDHISLGELTTVTLRDPFTIEVGFSNRRAKKLKIYDPALVAEFIERMTDRARVEVIDRQKR